MYVSKHDKINQLIFKFKIGEWLTKYSYNILNEVLHEVKLSLLIANFIIYHLTFYDHER